MYFRFENKLLYILLQVCKYYLIYFDLVYIIIMLFKHLLKSIISISVLTNNLLATHIIVTHSQHKFTYTSQTR